MDTFRCSLCDLMYLENVATAVVITKSTTVYCCPACASAVAQYEALKKTVRAEDRVKTTA